ncbi:peptide deformylase [Candidatus Peregrinibacteria bacterium]|nr:MAG: peptide deformylase [Candidatus Peregrinibacteria bacterium]
MKLTGFNARIIQHELDHLNGMLFVDRIHPDDYENLLRNLSHPII